MDDFVKRTFQTIAFVFGMMLLAYVLIATGLDKPALLTLVYYNFMNRVFAAIWWFIRISVLVGGIAGIAFVIFQFWKAKRNKEVEKELKLKQAKILEEEKRIRQEEKEIRQEELKRKAELEEFKKQQLLIEKELYLKNRSAEEANNDALKHFL